MELKIKIPERLEEITLGQYQKFFKIAAEFEDNEESIFLQQKMIQIFCDVELALVAQMQYRDVIEICGKLNALFTTGDKFIDRFTLGGIEFGFMPNLDNITFGEYSNLDDYIVDFDTMHKAAAVMYRPIIKSEKNGKYLIAEYNGTAGYAEKMRDMPLNVVFGAMVFFWDLSNELLIATLNYLEKAPAMAGLVRPGNSVKNGVGTPHITPSQMAELKTLKARPNFQYTRV